MKKSITYVQDELFCGLKLTNLGEYLQEDSEGKGGNKSINIPDIYKIRNIIKIK
jgi:hypothetical protein